MANNHHHKQPVDCSVWNWSFSRPSDRARHKCSAERARPVLDQKGARHFHRCDHWFRSAGGTAVRRCGSLPSVSTSYSVTISNLSHVDLAAVGLGFWQLYATTLGLCDRGVIIHVGTPSSLP